MSRSLSLVLLDLVYLSIWTGFVSAQPHKRDLVEKVEREVEMATLKAPQDNET